MKMPLAEIIDRYSILRLKNDRANQSNDLSVFLIEIPERYYSYSDKLYEVNGKIWDLEADLRQGKEGLLGVEEVGRRAIQIREFNNERVRIKNEIAKLEEEFLEVKTNHASGKGLKILYITSRFPSNLTGADEQDVIEGIKNLRRLGHEVKVMAKYSPADIKNLNEVEKACGLPIIPVPAKIKKIRQRLFFWDGAAYEWDDPVLYERVDKIFEDWKPDVLWLHYTYLSPIAKRYKHRAKIITRVANFEPGHFISEEGWSGLNILKFVGKLFTEIRAARNSNVMLCVNPKEANIYKWLGADALWFPAQNTPLVLKQSREIKDHSPLHVFFIGSTYQVKHNCRAAEFFITKVIPLADEKYPNEFVFHVVGRKLPLFLEKKLGSAIYEGFVPDLDAFLDKMDIAVLPSISGWGTQFKILENVCRGMPTIASERGIAGYPFYDGQEIRFAKSPEDFVEALGELSDISNRQRLSQNAISKTNSLFSQKAMDIKLEGALLSLYTK